MADVAVAAVLLSAAISCSSASETSLPTEPGATASGDPNTDKLAQILDRGTLVGYFEPEFPPQDRRRRVRRRRPRTGVLSR
jgi:hypothetical protein